MLLESSITVVVPVSNMAGNLANLREWMSNSDLTDFFVILVHDIRDFETGFELEEIQSSHPANCKIIEGVFGNPGAARNAGIKISKTPWICFWDADDIPNVQAFRNLWTKTIAENSNIGVGNFSQVNLLTDKETIEKFPKNFSQLLDSCVKSPGLWRFIFSRNAIENVTFPEICMGEDAIFLLRIFDVTQKVSFIDQSIYTYFQGVPNQLTSRPSKGKDLVVGLEEIDRQVLTNRQVKRFGTQLSIKFSGSIIKGKDSIDKLQAIGRLIKLILISPRLTIRTIFLLFG